MTAPVESYAVMENGRAWPAVSVRLAGSATMRATRGVGACAGAPCAGAGCWALTTVASATKLRSEERRVGKECRSGWAPEQETKKNKARFRSRCETSEQGYQGMVMDLTGVVGAGGFKGVRVGPRERGQAGVAARLAGRATLTTQR